MRIRSGVSYVVAYSVFVIPSHHYIVTAATTIEDHDLQTKVLQPGKIEATYIAKVKPVEGVLSAEEEEKEVEPSQNRIKRELQEGSSTDEPTQEPTTEPTKEPTTEPTKEPSCSDDTTWTYGGDFTQNCGWVFYEPQTRCSLSSGGVDASFACPIACGLLRTQNCDIPECNDARSFWKNKVGGKGCNTYLKNDIFVKTRCGDLGLNLFSGPVPNEPMFAYETCNQCEVCIAVPSDLSSPSVEPSESLAPSSDPTETPICSDDTTWAFDGDASKNCGWVYKGPDLRCSKSAGGVEASFACPIACKDYRTKNCHTPKCNDARNFWKNEVGGKGCNSYLKNNIFVKTRCDDLGLNLFPDPMPNEPMFAYETCSQCLECIGLTVPSATPSVAPSSVTSAIPSLAPSVTPSAGPTDIESAVPSSRPTETIIVPFAKPSTAPTLYPSAKPSTVPYSKPSAEPSSSPSVVPTLSRAPSSIPTETPLCSDDTSWFYDGDASKNCGWVYKRPDLRCSKSAGGVEASFACPIACGDDRTKNCHTPECNNLRSFWKNEVGGKGCNAYLKKNDIFVKTGCGDLGLNLFSGPVPNEPMFAYETCNQCEVCIAVPSDRSSSSVEPSESPAPSSNPTETPICSDDTTWAFDGHASKNCGWVYKRPDLRCSKSAGGVEASFACPIACGDDRTKNCHIPGCNDAINFWKSQKGPAGKRCKLHLNGKVHLNDKVKKKCTKLGVNLHDNDEPMFAYETCSTCNACDL